MAEFKLKVYSLANCVFNVEIPRRYVDKCYEKLIKANESVPDAFVQEIPTIYDAHLPGFDCEKFFRDFVKQPHPVVLKGFAKEGAATQWTLDSLIARFGEDEVKLKTKDGDNVPGKMKDLNTFPNYLHNCESLFLEHPELAKQLQVNRLEKLAGNKRIANDHPTLGPLPLQLFADRGGTGTAFHCAHEYHFFFQIEGVKKWTFVDPRWTMFMFPAINRRRKKRPPVVRSKAFVSSKGIACSTRLTKTQKTTRTKPTTRTKKRAVKQTTRLMMLAFECAFVRCNL